jgi:hypothetical protein
MTRVLIAAVAGLTLFASMIAVPIVTIVPKVVCTVVPTVVRTVVPVVVQAVVENSDCRPD